jgi:hypothetical protein
VIVFDREAYKKTPSLAIFTLSQLALAIADVKICRNGKHVTGGEPRIIKLPDTTSLKPRRRIQLNLIAL